MTQIRSEFPRATRCIEHLWIPLADGTRLAARVWLPVDAETDPVPAILEASPYRLTDGGARDWAAYPYWAGHGYACVRLDLRGTGDSDGVILDEYTAQEHRDVCEAIAWIAAQPWCTGAVGMTGISWTGFNSLQVAALRPPALKAIITLMSTDDRYADDVHYTGGCVSGLDMQPWGASMLHYDALPRHPQVTGQPPDEWRRDWLARLEANANWAETWLSHQRRDAYWKHGSVCEDYGAIEAAVYAIGGWTDGYRNAVTRLMAGLSCPRKGLIGPWSHAWPNDVAPGPAIGFLQECLRWWDHWLKGVADGDHGRAPAARLDGGLGRAGPAAPRAPRALGGRGRLAVAAHRPDGVEPERRLARRGAGARDGDRAPRPAGHRHRRGGVVLRGRPRRLADRPARRGRPLAWSGTRRRWPRSSRSSGIPRSRSTLAVDKPVALVCVRLCDVAPDGCSKLVTRHPLNLTHRESHEHPEPLEPGRRYDVTVPLDSIAHTFRAGHRLRVAVSTDVLALGLAVA